MAQKGAKNRLFLSILKTGTPPVCAAGPEKTEILIFWVLHRYTQYYHISGAFSFFTNSVQPHPQGGV